ncbi:DNA repair protein RecN [Chryseobacterium sp. POL2]|uniref:DNA repair protein RecN n=1 Tax=Chryseobacterium sp. POL2 TaxID=2713414 RepID=UPI0013E14664|nr:DNA repair protein RecN [Chryseobacterium sp. POL2]QIG89966.1 DNA repair protein RecN [Chryseobacterium sp. POL2]
MLSRIIIQNFALIDHLDIQLHKAMEVITGETGAGKSIILGALRLIMGERADLKSISNTDKKCLVEAHFSIKEDFKSFFDEQDLDFDVDTIIRREILASGKSRAFVNDVPVTLDILKDLSSKLIDIHSQFETSQLFTEDYQFQILDSVSKNQKELEIYQSNFSQYQALKRQLQTLKQQFAEAHKEADYKNFLLNELNELQLDQIDFKQLQDELSLQENAEFISENLGQIIQKFHQEELGVLSHFLEAKQKLQKISDVSPKFEELQKRFDESYFEIKDILQDLESELEKVEIDPAALAEMLQQTNLINALFLKHQVTEVEALVGVRNQLEKEQSGFQHLEEEIAEIESKILKLEKTLEKEAKELSKLREKGTPNLVEQIETLLKQLGLEKAKIGIELTESSQYNVFGKEHIQILFQANSGFPMKPIHTAISGGERSRVMLAIKKVLAEHSNLPTLILDEIDTGVSGRVAEEIGKVMYDMGKNMQLIVITHLAQVAAKADHHYKVTKMDVDGLTRSNIIPLSDDERLHEIAQLLSGSTVTQAAISQAKELMNI